MLRKDEERFLERQRTARGKAKNVFRKVERWKNWKKWRKMGLLIQRNIGKSGNTRSKKEKKRKRPGKRKIFSKRERVSFRSRSNKFRPAHMSTCQRHQYWHFLPSKIVQFQRNYFVLLRVMVPLMATRHALARAPHGTTRDEQRQFGPMVCFWPSISPRRSLDIRSRWSALHLRKSFA